MEANKIDKNIKDKLKNRSLQPSDSAWERLSAQLDEQPKITRKKGFFYVGIAASILLLFSVGFSFFMNSGIETKLNQQVVVIPIDTLFKDKMDAVFKGVTLEEAIVKKDRVEVGEEKNIGLPPEKRKNRVSKKVIKHIIRPNIKEKIRIAQVDKSNLPMEEIQKDNNVLEIKTPTFKQSVSTSIKVNSADLLYAVTHTKSEIKEYYAKYQIDREDVLKAIESQLKKSSLKIHPNIILAEVERTIQEEDFKNHFLESLKNRVRNIATAIASRND